MIGKGIFTLFRNRYVRGKVLFSECRIEDVPSVVNLYKEESNGTNNINIADEIASVSRSLTSLKDWGFWLIAKYKEKVIGSVVIRRFPDEILYYRDWWVFSLFVGEKYRNLGIGKTLMEKAIEKAKESGAKKINLIVNSKALPAINLYKHLGFTEISIPGIDEELVRRELEHNWKGLIMGFRI